MTELERGQVELMSAGMWDALKSEIRTACEAMTSLDLRIFDHGSEFRVERVDQGLLTKRLRLEFEPLAPLIQWKCCEPGVKRGVIEFRVSRNTVQFVVGNIVQTTDTAAQILASCITGQV